MINIVIDCFICCFNCIFFHIYTYATCVVFVNWFVFSMYNNSISFPHFFFTQHEKNAFISMVFDVSFSMFCNILATITMGRPLHYFSYRLMYSSCISFCGQINKWMNELHAGVSSVISSKRAKFMYKDIICFFIYNIWLKTLALDMMFSFWFFLLLLRFCFGFGIDPKWMRREKCKMR